MTVDDKDVTGECSCETVLLKGERKAETALGIRFSQDNGCVWLRQPPARAWVRSPQLYLCSIDVRSNQSILKMGAVASGERNVTLYEEKRSSSASAGPRHPACHRLTQACQHFEDVCAHLSRLPCPWPSSDIAMRMLSTTMKHVW